jgi:hypothetical protein
MNPPAPPPGNPLYFRVSNLYEGDRDELEDERKMLRLSRGGSQVPRHSSPTRDSYIPLDEPAPAALFAQPEFHRSHSDVAKRVVAKKVTTIVTTLTEEPDHDLPPPSLPLAIKDIPAETVPLPPGPQSTIGPLFEAPPPLPQIRPMPDPQPQRPSRPQKVYQDPIPTVAYDQPKDLGVYGPLGPAPPDQVLFRGSPGREPLYKINPNSSLPPAYPPVYEPSPSLPQRTTHTSTFINKDIHITEVIGAPPSGVSLPPGQAPPQPSPSSLNQQPPRNSFEHTRTIIPLDPNAIPPQQDSTSTTTTVNKIVNINENVTMPPGRLSGTGQQPPFGGPNQQGQGYGTNPYASDNNLVNTTINKRVVICPEGLPLVQTDPTGIGMQNGPNSFGPGGNNTSSTTTNTTINRTVILGANGQPIPQQGANPGQLGNGGPPGSNNTSTTNTTINRTMIIGPDGWPIPQQNQNSTPFGPGNPNNDVGNSTNTTTTTTTVKKAIIIGPDGQPIPQQSPPAGAFPQNGNFNSNNNSTNTNTSTTVNRAVMLGPEGIPLAQPQPFGSQPGAGAGGGNNPATSSTTTTTVNKTFIVGADGQPIPQQPTGLAPSGSGGPAGQNNSTSTTTTVNRMIILGPDGQPLPQQGQMGMQGGQNNSSNTTTNTTVNRAVILGPNGQPLPPGRLSNTSQGENTTTTTTKTTRVEVVGQGPQSAATLNGSFGEFDGGRQNGEVTNALFSSSYFGGPGDPQHQTNIVEQTKETRTDIIRQNTFGAQGGVPIGANPKAFLDNLSPPDRDALHGFLRAAIIQQMLSNPDTVPPELRQTMERTVRERIEIEHRTAPPPQIRAMLEAEFQARLDREIRPQMEAAIRAQVEREVRSQVERDMQGMAQNMSADAKARQGEEIMRITQQFQSQLTSMQAQMSREQERAMKLEKELANARLFQDTANQQMNPQLQAQTKTIQELQNRIKQLEGQNSQGQLSAQDFGKMPQQVQGADQKLKYLTDALSEKEKYLANSNMEAFLLKLELLRVGLYPKEGTQNQNSIHVQGTNPSQELGCKFVTNQDMGRDNFGGANNGQSIRGPGSKVLVIRSRIY